MVATFLKALKAKAMQYPHDIAVRAHANATARNQPRPSVEERAKRYMEENPTVYPMFSRFTHEALANGRTHIGAKMVAERMRWESLVKGKDGWKVNNTYISVMARRFMAENPLFGEVFQTRTKKEL